MSSYLSLNDLEGELMILMPPQPPGYGIAFCLPTNLEPITNSTSSDVSNTVKRNCTVCSFYMHRIRRMLNEVKIARRSTGNRSEAN